MSAAPAIAIASPLDLLLPYQRKWTDDAARFKIGVWSRQTGKSFACAGEAVTTAITEPKTEWLVMSAGERQALEFMRKVREWSEAWKVAISGEEELRDSTEALLKSAVIEWPNGSRIMAVPANPDTVRGFSANLILDEFAFHEDPDAIWRAIYPSITNPLKGEKKIRIVSTPNGTGNKFHDLWSKENKWSKHKVTIEDAVRLGLPVDIEALRAGLDDPEGWQQEFLCEFLDSAAVLLPYEVIALAESAEAECAAPAELWTGKRRDLVIGMDFARKGDLSVAWTFEKVGDVAHTREVLEMRNTSTPDQAAALRHRIKAARRICVDYTGPGIGLGDLLVQEHGEYDPGKHKFGKVELVTFTNTSKLELFPALRPAFEARRLRIPVSRAIREDLHSMQRATTPGGSVTYRAPHGPNGHADRCTALALAWRAFCQRSGNFHYSSITPGNNPGGRGARNHLT